MAMIHEMGGLTYVPHPLDRHRSNFTVERMVALADRIDIIEAYNAWCEPAENQAAARLAVELGKVAATGSDAHAASELGRRDRKSTRLNSSHQIISYAVFCLKT